jgi:hypothetical protein
MQRQTWAMRKNNPQLKQMVDEFFQTRAVGTSIGNTLLRRYLQNAKWIKNSLSQENEQTFAFYAARIRYARSGPVTARKSAEKICQAAQFPRSAACPEPRR